MCYSTSTSHSFALEVMTYKLFSESVLFVKDPQVSNKKRDLDTGHHSAIFFSLVISEIKTYQKRKTLLFINVFLDFI